MLTVTDFDLSSKVAYMELKDRIKFARKSARLTQEALAKKIGISRPAVALWETGQTKAIESKNLMLAANACRVDPLWLATGAGEIQPNWMVRDELGEAPPRLVNAWRQLDDEMKEHILAIIEYLARHLDKNK